MTFSIIVPVHNSEKYIDEMMKSAVAAVENAGVDSEVVLIENGSTDSSVDICDNYERQYPFVRTYHYGAIGAFEARREGIRKAEGNWLIFVDSDDVLCADAVEKLQEGIKQVQAGNESFDILVYNAASLKDDSARLFSFPFNEGKVYAGKDKEIFYEVMCRNDSLNALWNKCIRADLARRVVENGTKEKLNHGEDLIQTAAFIDTAAGIKYIDEILYLYRENENGLTSGYHPDLLVEQDKAWKKFDEYAAKWFGDKFTKVIDARKSLTCSICVKNIIYSLQPMGVKNSGLKEIMNSEFYSKYAMKELPEWAPEEDVFVHRLQTSDKPFKSLYLSGLKYGIKARIKRIIKNGL